MKKKNFFGWLVTVIVFGISSSAFSQEKSTFKIIDNGSVKDINLYEEAVKKADMENYRYKTKRNIIEFDNGLKVELLSAQEMFILNLKVDMNNYSDTRDPKYIQPIFHLTDQGTLVAMYRKVDPK